MKQEAKRKKKQIVLTPGDKKKHYFSEYTPTQYKREREREKSFN